MINHLRKETKMSRTFEEVCEELERVDEVTLLEVLDIKSEELVAKFKDKIEEDFENISENVLEQQEDPFMIDFEEL